MKTRKFQTVLCLIFFTAIWATASASGTLDPCKLITKAEMEVLVGEPLIGIEQKDARNPLGQKMCLFTTNSGRLIQISIIRTADIDPGIQKHGQSAVKIYGGTKEMLDPVEQVSGIGDDACWGAPGLHILKGETYVLVTVGNTSIRKNLDLAKRIAGKVLPRI